MKTAIEETAPALHHYDGFALIQKNSGRVYYRWPGHLHQENEIPDTCTDPPEAGNACGFLHDRHAKAQEACRNQARFLVLADQELNQAQIIIGSSSKTESLFCWNAFKCFYFSFKQGLCSEIVTMNAGSELCGHIGAFTRYHEQAATVVEFLWQYVPAIRNVGSAYG